MHHTLHFLNMNYNYFIKMTPGLNDVVSFPIDTGWTGRRTGMAVAGEGRRACQSSRGPVAHEVPKEPQNARVILSDTKKHIKHM